MLCVAKKLAELTILFNLHLEGIITIATYLGSTTKLLSIFQLINIYSEQ